MTTKVSGMYLKVHVTTKESIQRSVVRGRCLTGLKDMKECIYSMERTKDKREGITWSSPGTGLDAGQVSRVYAILDVGRSPGMRLGSLLQLVPWHSGVVWFLLQLVPRQHTRSNLILKANHHIIKGKNYFRILFMELLKRAMTDRSYWH